MHIIAVANQKGGVGKTTSTLNIGAGLARAGKKVCLVDFDPQANLTYSCGVLAHELDHTVYELVKDEADLKQVYIQSNGVGLIPASLGLSGFEVEINRAAGDEYFLLRESLEPLAARFDYILIDCPPNLGLLTMNALTAAREVFVVLQTEYLSMQGLGQLKLVIDRIAKRLNPGLAITGVLCTLFDGRTTLHREVLAQIKAHFDGVVFQTPIRKNIALAEAPVNGQDIFTYAARSHGAADYRNLCKELLRRG